MINPNKAFRHKKLTGSLDDKSWKGLGEFSMLTFTKDTHLLLRCDICGCVHSFALTSKSIVKPKMMACSGCGSSKEWSFKFKHLI